MPIKLFYYFLLFWSAHVILTAVKIRLEDGPDNLLGRLEVLFGTRIWGTVCDDNFDDIAASVACKQMGHHAGILLTYAGHPTSPVPQGNGLILMDDLACEGNETSLDHCMTKQWGDHACVHHEDVILQCFPHLRLGQDAGENTGHLEILYDGTWGGICAHDFGSSEASVACSEMGYHTGYALGTYTETDRLWLDYLKCDGSEDSLAQCRKSKWGTKNCENSEGVILQCLNGSDTYQELRLYGGQDSMAGVLEVQYLSVWGTVCYNLFDDMAATVACREMGFTSGQYLRFVGNTTRAYPWHNHTIWYDNVQCSGSEAALRECTLSPLGAHNCDHWQDVVMHCFDGKQSTQNYELSFFHGINHVSGRLEMIYGGVQFVFCKSAFDTKAINVACKDMGMLSGGLIKDTRFIEATTWEKSVTDNILWKMSVYCHGNESKLVDCFAHDWLELKCDIPDQVLAIYCSGNEIIPYYTSDENRFGPVVQSINDQSNLIIGFNKTYLYNDVELATLVCRDYGYDIGQVYYYLNGSDFPYIDIWYIFRCYGYENKLSDCVSEVHNNHDQETFYVECFMKYKFYVEDRVTQNEVLTSNSSVVGRLFMRYYNSTTVKRPGNSYLTLFRTQIFVPCIEGFSASLAGDICRSMGFKHGILFSSSRYRFVKPTTSIYLGGLKCSGQESSVQQCLDEIDWEAECPRLGVHTINDIIIKCVKDGQLDFRIQHGQRLNSGQLEVFYQGSWEAVCFTGNNSDLAAHLACTHLGYSSGEHVFYNGLDTHCGSVSPQNRTWFYGIWCLGHEADLFDCQFGHFGQYMCNHCKDAILQCRRTVQLVGPVTKWPQSVFGFLEMSYKGQWHRVCTDYLDNNIPGMVCKELGFGRGKQVFDIDWNNFQTNHRKNISVFSGLKCIGNESSISECVGITRKKHYCEPESDVVLTCWNDTLDPFQVRLVDGKNESSGRLEIYNQGQWGTMCGLLDQDGNIPDVACRDLGFTSGSYIKQTSFGIGPIWQGNFLCMGNEKSLLECDRKVGNGDNCSDHSMDIHVNCWDDSFRLRLFGAPVKNIGRLEIKYRNRWGTICNRCDFHPSATKREGFRFDMFYFYYFGWKMDPDKTCDLDIVARVACKQMGYPTGMTFRPPDGLDIATEDVPVWITHIACKGDESKIDECNMEIDGDEDQYSDEFYSIESFYFLEQYFYELKTSLSKDYMKYLHCDHDRDLYVECFETELQLSGGVQPNVGRLEMRFTGSPWGTVCDDLFTETPNAANVACKELGYDHGNVF